MADSGRSPKYPAIDLPTVLRYSKQLYLHEGKSAVSMEALSQALGHEGLSGAARTKISTLRQFGLIERLAGDRYRLSRIGVELAIHDPGDREYKAAARQAAGTPKLFADLMSEYSQASENSVRLHLIKDKSFSDLGARKAARAFALTRQAAGLGDGGDIDEVDDHPPDAPVAATSTEQPPMHVARHDLAAGASIGPNISPTAYSWPLTGGVKAELHLSGSVTPEAIDMLVEYLNLMKRTLLK